MHMCTRILCVCSEIFPIMRTIKRYKYYELQKIFLNRGDIYSEMYVMEFLLHTDFSPLKCIFRHLCEKSGQSEPDPQETILNQK